jgi:2-polyprenyl-3-methyl-5-hydroxy-6-metoxy-1,4-benzoquinol methylase
MRKMTENTDIYINSCPVGCNTTLVPTNVILPEGALHRCPGCGQLTSRSTEARYLETMATFNHPDFNRPSPREDARRRKVARRRFDTIISLLGRKPGDMRLVDVGCSRGQFVQYAGEAGFRAEGVEPAPTIAKAAQDAGLNVHTGLLEEVAFPDASFDVASLFEVVEHLREPGPLVAECARILKPGGVLLISTGNADSWTATFMRERWDYFQMAQDGGHVSFFNPQSLTLLAQRAGFGLARMETARVKFHERSQTTPTRYVMGKLLAELLNVPARWAGRGHDMLGYFVKPRDAFSALTQAND